jgi:hypothetical protein
VSSSRDYRGYEAAIFYGELLDSFLGVLYDGDSSLGRRSMRVAEIYMRLHTNSHINQHALDPMVASDDIQ